jgi:hypothetical protein
MDEVSAAILAAGRGSPPPPPPRNVRFHPHQLDYSIDGFSPAAHTFDNNARQQMPDNTTMADLAARPPASSTMINFAGM